MKKVCHLTYLIVDYPVCYNDIIMTTEHSDRIGLPSPFTTGGLPLAEGISQRRSVRSYSPEPILLFQLSQILWAAQGITDSQNDRRAIPSAGGTYPLEIYAVIGENGVETVNSGVYHYEVEDHVLHLLIPDDVRPELADAALNQDFISVAPVSLIICAIYDRALIRYSNRGERYVFIEVGHSGQNIYLQTTALGLRTVAVGAFKDEQVRKVLKLDSQVRPLYIMPIGKSPRT
jgi:SagB-type dehydrogenase family enzyme